LTPLDTKVKHILDTFEIECYGDHGQIRKADVVNGAPSTDYFEFDLVARIGRVGILIENTEQTQGNRRKIRGIVDHFEEFVHSPTLWKRKIRLLTGIPANKRRNFVGLDRWMYVYVGTSNELIERHLDEAVYPGKPLKILNVENFRYLKFLSDRVGKFGKSELLKKLEIEPDEAGDNRAMAQPLAIRLPTKQISKDGTMADLFIFSMPVLDLLTISRVARYGSLGTWMPELGGRDYQRILSPEKLNSIRDFLNKAKDKATFPNAITVVLSKDIGHSPKGDYTQLSIPKAYGSVEVIDGQHRLFGYANSKLKDSELEHAHLLVVGLQFLTNTERTLTQWSAKTFVEVNRTQTKVPSQLILLISNSVMGERNPKALAARVLVELNTQVGGPLHDIFLTRPFQRKNRVGGPAVRIVTVVAELATLFDQRNSTGSPQRRILYNRFSNSAWASLLRGGSTPIINEARQIMRAYFEIVTRTFPADWNSGESLIFTSKYLASFCRLMIGFLENNRSLAEMESRLNSMKIELENFIQQHNRTIGPSQELFWKGNTSISTPLPLGFIPAARSSIIDIRRFLESLVRL